MSGCFFWFPTILCKYFIHYQGILEENRRACNYESLEKRKISLSPAACGNPVDWYPWGSEAFEKAKEKDCPVFLSIGYSTCHWCHVMAHEAFEDEEVAEILNNHYICIKVDREERPDIDSVYMAACQAVTGSGGWPLTAILAPDQTPFFLGTYFPKHERYGHKGLPHNLLFLLFYGTAEQDKDAVEMAEHTLTAMAHGGMNDHIGGGFSRYSTDEKWLAPLGLCVKGTDWSKRRVLLRAGCKQ